MNEIRFIDLFGGIGGFRLGLERANNRFKTVRYENLQENVPNNKKQKTRFVCVWYCDNDKYAVQTYNKNFNETYTATDIRTIKASEIPDFDMLCGGFPCQAFSIAGKRRGFKDTRGTLFFEIARIVKAKKPKIVFLENVKGLLNHEKGQTFSVIIKTLWELGYDVQWMVLNSKFFGVPQNRERVFIIANIRGTSKPEILPIRKSNKKSNRTSKEARIKRTRFWNYATNALAQRDYKGGNQVIRDKEIYRVYEPDGLSPCLHNKTVGWQEPKIIALRSYPRKGTKEIDGERFQNIEPRNDKVTNTLSSVNKDNLLINEGIRRLTPIECERLQGFPDNWTAGVSDTQRYKQLGNAVTVNVIEAIGEKL